jgi:sarcosine oxidase, subunit gamma
VSVPTSQLSIIDLSERPRLGFKGRGTLPAMQKRGIVVENRPNRAFQQADGALCLVLAASEVFLLGAHDGDDSRFAKLEADWRIEDGERTYPMPRRHSHAWFAVEGEAAPDMLAKLCAIDFRPQRFSDLAIAQTLVARLNAIVLRADIRHHLTYHVLADSASAVYLLNCLKDSAEEFGGSVMDAMVLMS